VRGRLVALGLQHLLRLCIRQPVHGVVGLRVAREELQKLPELVGAEDVGLDASFTDVRIADAQLGIGAEAALRIAVDQAPEVLAGGQPVLLGQFLGAALKQKDVGVRLSKGGDRLLGTTGARADRVSARATRAAARRNSNDNG